ncbi:MAG: sulfurtransferase [candidate division Zixibacteria bacterium]|nr:sulfurtransferase [candidate division Zixibacteria bacterium]
MKEPFKSLKVLMLFSFLIAVFLLQASAQELSSKLVSVEWLKDNLVKKDLRIIDIRSNIRDYWEGHIPDAVFFSTETMRLSDHGVPGKLLPPKIFATVLGELGIDRETKVVVYSKGNDFMATYFIWALDYIWHSNAVILEGGFERWKKEERPVTQDYPRIKPVKYRLPSKLHQEVRASLEEVKKVVEKGGAVLLDVRPVQLYSGEMGSWKRKGHIQGAINRFLGEDLNEDGTWKSKEELKEVYEKLGVTPDKTIITSCGQGLMSSHTYFTLKYILGYPQVKNYDGSFNEWSNIDELPVETGVK